MGKFVGIFNQMMRSVLQWGNKLIGRGSGETKAQKQPQTKQANVDSRGREVISKGEDPVAKDVQKLESVLQEGVGKAKENKVAKGVVGRTRQIILSVFGKLKDMVTGTSSGGSGTLGKVVALLIVIALLVILVNFARSFYGRVGGNGEVGNGIFSDGPSPTPIQVVQTREPSVYADDEEILQLERNIGLLENNMNESSIRETRLNPPNLDFNISF